MIAFRPAYGARAAVAASVALVVATLVGVPAYVSSTGSAALAIQLDEACLTNLGVTFSFADEAGLARLDGYLDGLDDVRPPEVIRGSYFSFTPAGHPDAAAVSTVMYARPEQFEQLGIGEATPGVGEILVPEWSTAHGGLLPGTSIDVTPHGFFVANADGSPEATLLVAGTYPDIPFRPEPAYWCSYAELIRPDSQGDRPSPMLLATSQTFDELPATTWFQEWQLTPDPDGLRRDEAAALVEALESLNDQEWELVHARHPEFERRQIPPVALDVQVRRSGQVADFVALTIAPLRFAAVAAAVVLLCAAGVLAARAQQRELRLRALRGVGVFGLARLQIGWLSPVTALGAIVGALTGWAAVRIGGPSPEIEPAAIRSGLIAGGVGWLVAAVIVAVVIGRVGAGMVDRRRRSFVNPRVVGEVAIVGLAGWSMKRLYEFGGVRQVGLEVRGGDLLAQAFPLLGTMAIVAVAARPLAWLLRRGRRVGRGLPTPVFLGWRRVTAEPHISAAVIMTAALAVAIAFQASLLTRSVDRLLSDKAEMLVGSDLAIRLLGSPPHTEGLGTAVTEIVLTKNDDRSIVLLGVDPGTFEAAAFWRDDAAPISLREAMRRITVDPKGSDDTGPDGSLPAILVDPEGALSELPTTLSFDGDEFDLSIVTEAVFFPGYKSPSPMLVVDRSVVEQRRERSLWVRDPIEGAAERLQAEGGRVARTYAPEDVFDSTSFLSARWAYDTLTVFAAVLAVVTVIAQLLVLEARRRSRRVAQVLTQPMGLSRRGETVAVAVEVGVPLMVGGAIGALTGWFVATLAVGRLDSLRNLQPPAVLVVDFSVVITAGCLIVLATGVLAVLGSVRPASSNAGEVMRVAES